MKVIKMIEERQHGDGHASKRLVETESGYDDGEKTWCDKHGITKAVGNYSECERCLQEYKSKQMNKQFKVTWEIDIWSDSAENAAKEAREIQLDKESIATVFDVAEILEKEQIIMNIQKIDLSKIKEDDN